MTDTNANLLCKACGLCCSGHLFSWVRLNAPELDPVEKLGVKVIRNDPRQRGFTQPCPLWNGTCSIYTSHAYPRSCSKYRCKVLRRMLDDDIPFPEAMSLVEETLSLIHAVEALLPVSTPLSFRERLIAHKEHLERQGGELGAPDREFLQKAEVLLNWYDDRFGVDDFIDYES